MWLSQESDGAPSDDFVQRRAGARLRYRVLEALHEAHSQSGLTQVEVARRLGRRKSAVGQVLNGDGNVTINTLAHYLAVMGFEADLGLLRVGELDRAEVEGRDPEFVEEDHAPSHYKRRLVVTFSHRADDYDSGDLFSGLVETDPLAVGDTLPQWLAHVSGRR